MKWSVALVVAPALAMITFVPAFGKTVGPADFDGRGSREAAGRTQGDELFRRYGLFDLLAPGKPFGTEPVVPVAKSQKARGRLASSGRGMSEPEAVRQIVGNLLKGGAQHRKAVWPALDFTGYGKRRGGSGGQGGSGGDGGSGGGWDDSPPGGDPLDGGHDPIDMGGGSSQGPGGQGPGGQGLGGWNGPGGSGNGSGGDENCDPISPDPISPVPLPAAGWLMIAGLGGLAALGRRRASVR